MWRVGNGYKGAESEGGTSDGKRAGKANLRDADCDLQARMHCVAYHSQPPRATRCTRPTHPPHTPSHTPSLSVSPPSAHPPSTLRPLPAAAPLQVVVSVGLVAASSAAVIGWAPEAQGSGVPEVMAYLNGCMLPKVGGRWGGLGVGVGGMCLYGGGGEGRRLGRRWKVSLRGF